MKTRNRIQMLTMIACLLGTAFLVSRAYAQQDKASVTPQEDFLNSIRNGDAVKVRQLLKQDPSLVKATTKNGVTAVLVAVYRGRKEIADLLVASGIELNVFEAAGTGQGQRVRELLKKNPELVNTYSPDGWTPLHLNFGHPEIVEICLNAGADINSISKNHFKATPLQGAAASNWIDIARLLLARGANASPKGEDGESPLHEVAGSGQIEFAKLLLDHGADVNARGDKGTTPLSVALENKQTEMAKFLREHGAVL